MKKRVEHLSRTDSAQLVFTISFPPIALTHCTQDNKVEGVIFKRAGVFCHGVPLKERDEIRLKRQARHKTLSTSPPEEARFRHPYKVSPGISPKPRKDHAARLTRIKCRMLHKIEQSISPDVAVVPIRVSGDTPTSSRSVSSWLGVDYAKGRQMAGLGGWLWIGDVARWRAAVVSNLGSSQGKKSIHFIEGGENGNREDKVNALIQNGSISSQEPLPLLIINTSSLKSIKLLFRLNISTVKFKIKSQNMAQPMAMEDLYIRY
jgi:hypothetical protein